MILDTAILILGVAILLGLVRLVTARSDADRVIAVDLLAFQLIGLSLLLAAYDERPLALQFAFAMSLLAFLSTLVLSRLISE